MRCNERDYTQIMEINTDLEGMSDIVLNPRVPLHHHVDKFVEINGPVRVCVDISNKFPYSAVKG